MKGFVNVFLLEVKLLVTKPMRMFLSIGLPILIFSFFGYIFKKQSLQELPVAVMDNSNSSYSRTLVRMIESSQTLSIKYTGVDQRAGSEMMRTGKVYAYIVIPKDFDKDIMTGRQSKVLCYTNGQYMSAAGFIQSAFSTIMGNYSAGINIEKRMKKGQGRAQALASTQSIAADNHLLYNPYRNYNYFLNMGFIPMMFQMIVIYVSIFTFGMFFKTRTVDRLIEETGAGVNGIIFGKMLPYTLIFLAMAVLMNIFMFEVVGVPVKSSGYTIEAVFLSLVFVIVCQCIAFFAVCYLPNLRLALTIGGGYSAIAFAFTGYTFPLAPMPELVKMASNIFPITHFLDGYINVAIRGISATYSLGHMLWLLVFLLLPIISMPRFVKLIKKNGYEKNV